MFARRLLAAVSGSFVIFPVLLGGGEPSNEFETGLRKVQTFPFYRQRLALLLLGLACSLRGAEAINGGRFNSGDFSN